MLQNILLDLRIGSSILELRHIHIFQRELNPNLFRVDLTLGKQDNSLDLPDLKDEIEDAEKKVDELLAELNGRKPRKAFGIVPRDW